MSSPSRIIAAAWALSLLLWGSSPASAATDADAGPLADLVALDRLLAEPVPAPRLARALGRMQDVRPGSARALRLPQLTAAFYRLRGDLPVWHSATMVLSLRAALSGGELDGLAPGELRRLASQDPLNPAAPIDAAEREILLTDTLLALMERLANGVADARGLSPEPDAPLAWREAEATELGELNERLNDGDVPSSIDMARPRTDLYQRLRRAMQHQLELRDDALLPIGDGDTLEAGAGGDRIGDRIVRLRARLVREADLPADQAFSTVWDDRLEQAVSAFQTRNGLEADGKVGGRTRQRLDMSPQQRIDALRVNMERARWFAQRLGEQDRLVVNIPDYSLALHIEDEPVWRTRVIVGKPSNRTPVFVSAIDEVVIDPTWTVPRSIVEEKLFDEAKADPAAFAAKGFRLRDLGGQWRLPTDLDWNGMTIDRFHYDVVQMPGGQNALGRVKFMFDNPYSVYLHDTPSQSLFDKPSRMFSHGCVRVEDPHRLESLLLSERGALDSQAIAELRVDTDNIPVSLLESLPVGLLYWTVDVDEQGRLRLLPDIYGRDQAILDALDKRAAS